MGSSEIVFAVLGGCILFAGIALSALVLYATGRELRIAADTASQQRENVDALQFQTLDGVPGEGIGFFGGSHTRSYDRLTFTFAGTYAGEFRVSWGARVYRNSRLVAEPCGIVETNPLKTALERSIKELVIDAIEKHTGV